MQLLLALYCIVLFTRFFGTCLRPLVTFRGVTYRNCFEECERSVQCQFIIYRRHSAFCALHEDNGTHPHLRTPGLKIKLRNKIGNVGKTPDNSHCQRPTEIPGAVIRGNMVTVGSKIQYKCPGTSLKFPSRCLSNGYWSSTNLLRCNCAVPQGDHHAELDYQQIDERIIELILSCDAGYELLKLKNAQCNIETGKWKDTQWAGCYIMSKPPYRKLFSFVDGAVRGNWLHGNTFVNDLRGFGQFRNSTVFNNWHVYVQKRVRLEIIKDQTVVHLITFNGTGSDTISWFSQENILESSWSDLNSRIASGIVSIQGSDAPKIGFVVGTHLQKENDRCEHKGWFVVSLSDYLCGVSLPKGHKAVILYSKGIGMARFDSTEISVADRFEVWIEE